MSSQPSTEKQFYADAQAMLDELLRCGSLPPRLMRERLFAN